MIITLPELFAYVGLRIAAWPFGDWDFCMRPFSYLTNGAAAKTGYCKYRERGPGRMHVSGGDNLTPILRLRIRNWEVLSILIHASCLVVSW